MGLFSLGKKKAATKAKPKAKAAAKPKAKTKAAKSKNDSAAVMARMKKKQAENPDSCPFC
jgi:hypothetical protein